MRIVMAVAGGLLAVAATARAMAADVTVEVRDLKGAPVRDAVVAAYPAHAAHAAIRFGWPMQVDQRRMQFEPFVLIVPVGARVSFPNHDTVRHSIYSFSAAKRFQLSLYGPGETRSVTFDQAGVVALGCNIHDTMVAFIKVVDTPFAAKTDGQGRAVLRGLPPGDAPMRIWHPYQRAPGNEIVRTVTVPAGSTAQAAFRIDVRASPGRRGAL